MYWVIWYRASDNIVKSIINNVVIEKYKKVGVLPIRIVKMVSCFSLMKGLRSKRETLLSVSAVHLQSFHISICIWKLHTQDTTSMISNVVYLLNRRLIVQRDTLTAALLQHCSANDVATTRVFFAFVPEIGQKTIGNSISSVARAFSFKGTGGLHST